MFALQYSFYEAIGWYRGQRPRQSRLTGNTIPNFEAHTYGLNASGSRKAIRLGPSKSGSDYDLHWEERIPYEQLKKSFYFLKNFLNNSKTMKYIILTSFCIFCSCDSKFPENKIIFELFEIVKGSNLENNTYFSNDDIICKLNITNNDSIPIFVFGYNKKKILPPAVCEFSYIDEGSKKRNYRKGISDYFDLDTIIISPTQVRTFFFLLPFEKNVDTMTFVFNLQYGIKKCAYLMTYEIQDYQIISSLAHQFQYD